MIFALAKIVPSDREAGEARIQLAKASERIAEITSLRPALVSTSEGKGWLAYAAHHRDALKTKIDVKGLHDLFTAFDSIKISTTKAYDIPVGGIIVGNGSADTTGAHVRSKRHGAKRARYYSRFYRWGKYQKRGLG